MKTLILLAAIVSLGFVSPVPNAAPPLHKARGADEVYAKRTAEPLNAEELKAVGMWSGANNEVKWEMLRSDDGTYALVLYEEYQGSLYKDYIKGVWGINGDQYYYQDLEANNAIDFYPPTFETVVESTSDEFRYESRSDDGSVRVSIEKRVEAFSLDLWDKYGKQAKAVE